MSDQAKGKFRSFLLTAFKQFLASEWHRDRAFRRGGGQALISFDSEEAKERSKLEPSDTLTPEAIYDRRWTPRPALRPRARTANRWEMERRLFVMGAFVRCYL